MNDQISEKIRTITDKILDALSDNDELQDLANLYAIEKIHGPGYVPTTEECDALQGNPYYWCLYDMLYQIVVTRVLEGLQY